MDDKLLNYYERELTFIRKMGAELTIITFYRSGFLFFPLLVVPTLLIALWLYYKKCFLPSFLYFLTGFLCMFIIYGSFSYRISGSRNLNKPSIAWSFYEAIHKDGWVSDTFAPTPTEELYQAAQNYSVSLLSGTQALQKLPPAVYVQAGIRLIRKQPVQFLSQILARVTRMWMFVETYPERWHARTIWYQLLFRRSLIILGLGARPAAWNSHPWMDAPRVSGGARSGEERDDDQDGQRRRHDELSSTREIPVDASQHWGSPPSRFRRSISQDELGGREVCWREGKSV